MVPVSTKESIVFSGALKARLEELLPAYETFILEKNPTRIGRSPELIQWRKETTESLLDEQFFRDLIRDSSLEYEDWQNAVRRFFANYYNNLLPVLRRRESATNSHATSS
ncbi:hypothetical protein GALMADRAFT_138075 [Galerina marginata CBS 339.88]|uniref:Uncharacterized protein n=1 Tax=Galerina marginata (strain CBS 339.88) TaxID=685588 RepID=A0A067T414_GALM3|nr:hypothetical protein GALMADRAFT_138075 [Galerina marginata CBS 339.88]